MNQGRHWTAPQWAQVVQLAQLERAMRASLQDFPAGSITHTLQLRGANRCAANLRRWAAIADHMNESKQGREEP